MKISKISTGKKLSIKNFEDLVAGDEFYCLTNDTINYEVVTYDVTKVYPSKTTYKIPFYTENNKEKPEKQKEDVYIVVKNGNIPDTFFAPKGTHWAAYIGKPDNFFIYATNLEVALSIIDKYNLKIK